MAPPPFPRLSKPVRRFLRWLGYETRPVSDRRWYLLDAQRLKLHARTIVDVGVGFGTPALYDAFPDAYYLLVEPVREFEPHLKTVMQKHRGHYVLTALGAQDDTRVLHIDPECPERSSLHTRTWLEGSSCELVPRQVPVQTLDALMAQSCLEPPFGLKIDTEGGEYDIITGARQFLTQTSFVIAEVAVGDRFEQGYAFRDFINLMHRHGFALCEILDMGRNDDSVLTFIDAVFRRLPSPVPTD